MPVGINKVSRNSQIGSDIPDSVVDNFNDADDSEEPGIYEGGEGLSNYYSGTLSDFDRNTSSPTLIGSHSLKNTTGNNNAEITSDTLNRVPSRGDTFSVFVRDIGGDDAAGPGLIFGYSGSSSFYGVAMNGSGEELIIYKDGMIGGESITQGGSFSHSQDTWYDLEMDWGDSTLTATLYSISDGERDSELTSTSADDTDYDSGEFGFFKSFSDGSCAWDGARIIE